jgi:hypothetical protein
MDVATPFNIFSDRILLMKTEEIKETSFLCLVGQILLYLVTKSGLGWLLGLWGLALEPSTSVARGEKRLREEKQEEMETVKRSRPDVMFEAVREFITSMWGTTDVDEKGSVDAVQMSKEEEEEMKKVRTIIEPSDSFGEDSVDEDREIVGRQLFDDKLLVVEDKKVRRLSIINPSDSFDEALRKDLLNAEVMYT